MPQTVGPASWLNQTIADLGLQQAQPLLDDAEQRRQSIGQAPVQPSYASMVPGLDALLGQTGQPAATGQQAPTTPPAAGGWLSSLPGLDSLLGRTEQSQPTQQPGMQIGSVTHVDGRQQSQPSMRPGEQMGDVSMSQGTGGLEEWARSEARRLGIDPDIAVKVAMSEGGFDDPVRQSDVVYQGEREQSYGPYQLNVNGGIGNEALARGIDPRNPAHARAAVTFALEHAARNGWGNFHGAERVGIGRWDGIGQQQSMQGPRPTTPPQAEQTPMARSQQAGAFDIGSTLERYAGGTYTFGGGRDQRGFGIPGERNTDCSGFVSSVWQEQGIPLPAHTDAAYNQLRGLGAAQVSEQDARPGDVVFYMGEGYGGNITYHMGIYAGPGQVLDASSRGGQGVRIRPLTHAGGPSDIVILRDPRVNGQADPRRAEKPPEIQPTGIAESPLGERLAATGGESLNAGGAPLPPATPSASAGVASPPADAPPPAAPWANETGGGQMMMKADDQQAEFMPGDGGYTPVNTLDIPDSVSGYTQNDESGPREATPGSVGSQPLPQTPNPMTYGPISQGDVAEGPPSLGEFTYQNGGAPTDNGDWYPMETRPMEAQQPQQVGQNQIDRYVPSYAPQASQATPEQAPRTTPLVRAVLEQIPGTTEYDDGIARRQRGAMRAYDERQEQQRPQRIISEANTAIDALVEEARAAIQSAPDEATAQRVRDQYVTAIRAIEDQANAAQAQAQQSEMQRQNEMADSATRSGQAYTALDRRWDAGDRFAGDAIRKLNGFYDGWRTAALRPLTDLYGYEQIGAETQGDRALIERLLAEYGSPDAMPEQVRAAFDAADRRYRQTASQGPRYASERNPATDLTRTAADVALSAASIPLMPGYGEAAGVMRAGTAAERMAMAARLAAGIAVDPTGAVMQGAIEGPIEAVRGAAALARNTPSIARRAGEVAQGVGREVAGAWDANAARVAAADARMAEQGGSSAFGTFGVTPNGGPGIGRALASGADDAMPAQLPRNPDASTRSGIAEFGPNNPIGTTQSIEPWQMSPEQWRAEMARVSPDGSMPDPQVDNAAYRRWYELNANKPVSETPALQSGPFETDSRLRPAIESSYLRPDDYRFVNSIEVDSAGQMRRDSDYLNAAGIGRVTANVRARHLPGGRVQFRPDVLSDPRAGRTMTHEVGHSIHDNLPESLQERWTREIHPNVKDPFEYGRYLQDGGEQPPTGYAGESPFEDFAETFTEWRQAQAEGRAPNLGPLRQRFMQDVDAWLSGGRSLERGTMDGQRFEQPRLLSTVAASPGGTGRDIWARAATDIGNSLAGGMAGAVYSEATGDQENLPRNVLAGMVGAPILGRGMRRAGGALGTPGVGPNGGRPVRRTVEVVQERLDVAARRLEAARAAGDDEAADIILDHIRTLESELVDLKNARLDLEPRIASDVGRRFDNEPTSQMAAEDRWSLGRERVSPQDAADLTPPSAVATDMSGRQNGLMPGFDPASALAGGAAGASDTDEEGNPDPLKTAAGVFVAGLGNSRYGRRFLANAARHAQQGPPPNLWEVMQGFRFSWGMLGNLAQTGLVNAAGGPVELALGLPTEAVRMALLHQRPIGVAHYTAEAASGLKDGARNLLATVLGEIPPSIRNASDFRPPMSERMAGRMGQIGSADTGAMVGEAIDLPGRLASQAPDALWRPFFLRAGAAKERNTILNEMGVSKLDPVAQWRELQRLKNSPTPAEAQRIAEASKKHADEMGLKGDDGYFENVLKGVFRPSGRITTSADPMMAQIHEAVGSFAMPFLGAVYKLHKLGATRLPLVGLAANSKLPLDEKLSRQIVGAGMMYLIADRAAQGMITGPGPSDPDEAAIVNKKMPPNSTYIPGVGWAQNDSFSSAGPYLNAIGAYYDARRYATEKDKTVAGKGDESTVKYVLRGFERFPVVQAVQSIIAMGESPIKGVSDFAANAASSFAPALYRTYQASQDPYARTVDREAGMNPDLPAGIKDIPGAAFAAATGEQTRQKVIGRVGYVPGVGSREDLQTALDRFGRPVENERQGVSAFLPNVKQPKDDELTNVFTRAGVEPGAAPSEVHGVPLTTEQKRMWLQERGRILSERLPILASAAEYPETTRKNVFSRHLANAAEIAGAFVWGKIPEAQRNAAQKKAS